MKVSIGASLYASELGMVVVREIDVKRDGAVTLLCTAADGSLVAIEAEIALPQRLTPAPKRLFHRSARVVARAVA